MKYLGKTLVCASQSLSYPQLASCDLWMSAIFLQVIAESLSEEEIAGLKEMFKMIDVDNSGNITLEELKTGLERVGADLKDSEIIRLMQAVSTSLKIHFWMLYETFGHINC